MNRKTVFFQKCLKTMPGGSENCNQNDELISTRIQRSWILQQLEKETSNPSRESMCSFSCSEKGLISTLEPGSPGIHASPILEPKKTSWVQDLKNRNLNLQMNHGSSQETHHDICLTPERSRTHPCGLSLWRETTLGKCLISCLEDFLTDFTFFSSSMMAEILGCFDQVMNQEMSYGKLLGHWKIVSGSIEKYKNLDGIWDMYISDFVVKDRRRCFMSDFIRIVAIEKNALNRLCEKDRCPLN